MNRIIKVSIFAFILLTTNKVFSQNTYGLPIDEATGKIHYQVIEKVDGSKDELFLRAQKWLHKFFRNASSVIKKLDQENGVIEGRRQIKVTTKDKKDRVEPAGTIKYTFRIEMKEGRYRVRLFDFKVSSNSSSAIESWFEDTDPKKVAIHEQIFKQIDEDVKKLLADLKKGMRPSEIKADDW